MNWNLNELLETHPILLDMKDLKDVNWFNPYRLACDDALKKAPLSMMDIRDAEARLQRFRSYLMVAFPETEASGGIIESECIAIPFMKEKLEQSLNQKIAGSLYLKKDSHLPISGSIKARGGIYEVLTLAETIAMEHGLLTLESDYAILHSKECYQLFSKYQVAVGSTGNLGLSIGIIGSKLGFETTVHMSADAKEWKKQLLRSKGVTVVEYEDDYSKAVEEGRKAAASNPMCHFVDDENSKTLFLGYAVAALRLQKQFEEQKIAVDATHPLFVYLPCGVGGGPGGVAFGLKAVFGDAVHCFFVEPTHSPCMTIGLITGLHDEICVQDFGIDNKTDADGLAVGRASSFVGKTLEPFINGCYTLTDQEMYAYLKKLKDTEDISLEPSALAGMKGPEVVELSPQGSAYLSAEELNDYMSQATHLIWATGGNMVPPHIMEQYYHTATHTL